MAGISLVRVLGGRFGALRPEGLVVFARALCRGDGVVAVLELDWFQSGLDVSILCVPLWLIVKLGR